MNGIAAIISQHDKVSEEILLKMLTWTKPCLVHTTSTPLLHQEMQLALGACKSEQFATNEDASIFVAISGMLIRTDTIPQANSDAERVVLAYEKWQEKCFEKLDGQFAIIIYDKRQNELYVARDRLGMHPLFWYQNKHVTLFATSLKALLATGLVSPTVDEAQLAAYFSLGFVSQDATLVQDINRLLPGYYIKRHPSGRINISPFWSYSKSFLRTEYAGSGSSLEIYREITKALENALNERATKSKEPCATSSSELGSYILWRGLKQKRDGIELPRQSYSYTQNRTSNKTELTAEDFLNSLIPIVWAQELPIGEVESVKNYYFAKRCHSENWSLFFDSGFAVEFENYAKHTFSTKEVKKHPERSALWRYLFSLFPAYALKKLRKSQIAKPQVAFFEYHALLQDQERKWATPQTYPLFDLNLFVHDFYHLDRIPALYESLFYLNVKTRLIDSVSEARLRLAQNCDVTSFSPFLDYKLLEFYASFTPDVWASPDILPSFPAHWLHEHEASLPALGLPIEPEIPLAWLNSKEVTALHNALKSGVLVESGYLSRSWLDALSKKHPEAYLRKLYAIAVLEVWMRLFIDLPIRESSAELKLHDLLKLS